MLVAMKLYNYFRSSASYRVRIALALKHAPFYPRFGAGDPRQLMVIDHDPLAVIGVDIHGPNAE